MSYNPSDGPKPIGPRPDVEQAKAHGTSGPGMSSPSGTSGRPAQFYSSPPGTQPPPDAKAPGASAPRWQLVAVGVLAAAAVVAAGIYGFSGGDSGSVVPVAAATDQVKTFSVGMADAAPQATAQLKAIFSGTAAGATEVLDRAINAPALKELEKTAPQMVQDIKSGRRVVYSVVLLDFLANDGDHAELFVDGVSMGDVYLTNAGSTILIPLAAGVPAQIKLVATADGGGGVTVAFVSSLGEARTRIMQVGEFEQWQVIVQ